MSQAGPTMEELLARHEAQLVGLVRREAGVALLRFDSVEDLLQGVRHEALRSAAGMSWEGDAAFAGWIQVVARRHLAARRDHWFARKRSAGAVLRLTMTDSQGRPAPRRELADTVGSSRVDLQACKLEYSIVSPK